MQNIYNCDQAELAPLLMEISECWYLSIFGVYHPQKPNKIWVVFNSSTQHQGISLNDIHDEHCFGVREDNRDFLHFLWFKGNDPGQKTVEYWIKVYVFGNSPSPAVAIYGLHQAAEYGAEEHGVDAKHFVERDFYVDDGLTSVPLAIEAIDLLTRTQEMLAASNLRLHKIASNCSNVLRTFSQEDCVKGLQNLDFDDKSVLNQHSLGLSWEIKHDIFPVSQTLLLHLFSQTQSLHSF